MRLLDDAETIVLVTGSSENARDRERPLAEAVLAAQEAGRKYINVASRLLAREAS